MSRGFGDHLLAALCAAAIVLMSSSTSGAFDATSDATKERAAEHFALGMQHVRSGEFRVALREFLRAYELVPHHAVLYNIGLAYADLAQPVQAIESLERYLEQGGETIDAERQTSVKQRLESLRASVGRIEISVKGGPASVDLDGATVGSSPLPSALEVNPGMHTLTARRFGHPPTSVSVDVAPGATVAVTLSLRTAPSPEPSAHSAAFRTRADTTSTKPRSPAPERPGVVNRLRAVQRPAALVAGALGVVGLGTGIGFALHARSKDRASDNQCGVYGNPIWCTPMGLELNREAMVAANTAEVLNWTGGVLLAGGLALWFTAPADVDSAGGDVRANVALSSGFRGALVWGVLP